jgi:uncharacterized small protein (TIGR04563 family)
MQAIRVTCATVVAPTHGFGVRARNHFERRGVGLSLTAAPSFAPNGRYVARGGCVSLLPSVAQLNSALEDSEPLMAQSDKRKQSLYFPESMLQEIQQEAARLDRSLSWVMQRAWKLARTDIRKLPSVNDVPDDGPDDERGREED